MEIKAGLPEEKLTQAHGHYRTAKCIECKIKHSMEEFKKYVEKNEIFKCKCGGLIKPDIVFFGEALPQDFY